MADSSPEVKAVARYIRMSPFKVRRVLDQIRGRTYADALILLEFMPYAACEPVRKAALGGGQRRAQQRLGSPGSGDQPGLC
jgi:ribosomal protein L22